MTNKRNHRPRAAWLLDHLPASDRIYQPIRVALSVALPTPTTPPQPRRTAHRPHSSEKLARLRARLVRMCHIDSNGQEECKEDGEGEDARPEGAHRAGLVGEGGNVMAVNRCRGCGDYFGADHEAVIFCSTRCKSDTHQKLAPSKPQPKPATIAICSGFQQLADESSRYNDYHQRMRRG